MEFKVHLCLHPPLSLHLLIFPSQLKQVEREFVGASLITPSSLYEEFLHSLKSELTRTYQQNTEEADEREEKEEEKERSTPRQPG